MNEQPAPNEDLSKVPQHHAPEPDLTAADLAARKRFPHSAPPEKRSHETSFVVEDSFYRSRLPKPTHWSVAWSDLMMTMFVLFLSMFVYQAAHEEFLAAPTPEIVGGDTTDALDINGESDLIVPIVPLKHKAPLITSGTIKKVEKVQVEDIDVDEVFREKTDENGQAPTPAPEPVPVQPPEPETPQLAQMAKKELEPIPPPVSLEQPPCTGGHPRLTSQRRGDRTGSTDCGRAEPHSRRQGRSFQRNIRHEQTGSY